jgi:hypothetical protein
MSDGYGKHYESTYTGSMCGSGAMVFAVWGYVIAHAKNGEVELNPKLMSAQLGEPVNRVIDAIDALQQEDPLSRNPEEDGRRLVHQSAFTYRVVSHHKYRNISNNEDRKAYNRQKQRESRARKRAVKEGCQLTSIDVSKTSASASASDSVPKDLDLPIRSEEARPADPMARLWNQPKQRDDVREVWELWCEMFEKPNARLDHTRAEVIAECLDGGDGLDDIRVAFVGAKSDDWLRAKGFQLKLILGDRERFERCVELGRGGNGDGRPRGVGALLASIAIED